MVSMTRVINHAFFQQKECDNFALEYLRVSELEESIEVATTEDTVVFDDISRTV